MSNYRPSSQLSIGEVADRTGVGVATLRAWERRHGFPAPGARREGSHRRYDEADLALIHKVVAERERGLSVAAAIEAAQSSSPRPGVSIFSVVRRAHPELVTQQLSKRNLTILSRAVEDETRARADRPLLIGAFQTERRYRASERRWRDLAAGAALAIALAGFQRTRAHRNPAEVAIDHSSPARREWAVVVRGPTHGAFLSGWELPGQEDIADGARRFEVVWSVEPGTVRSAAEAAVAVVARADEKLAQRAGAELDSRPSPPAAEQIELGAAITSRVLAALS